MTGLGYNPHTFSIIHNQPKAPLSAQDFEKGGIYYSVLSEDDKTVEVTENPNNYAGDVVIPAEVTYDGGTYSVTAIGYEAFFRCYALTSVSMPSVTAIGDHAFWLCESLTSVSMPSVTTIGYMAFIGCTALTSVSMPSVTTIGKMAFCNCNALTSVDIPASVTFIGINPFVGCGSLREIAVDDNNPNYSSADGVLYDKGKTTLIGWPTAEGEIDIMPSVTTIGEYAFDGCSALTSAEMPAVTTIGFGAFYNCYALTSVSMPSATTIGEQAFYYCSALTSVDMPSVTTIGVSAFSSCDALASVDIPASVTTIGDRAFAWCSGLTSVYCHWDEPLECEPEFTSEVLMNATLYVPTGTVDAYRSVFPWSEFLNIEEKDYSGIAGTFEVDGIYYNILSEDERTVEVISGSGSGRYEGDIVIPAEVTYDGGTYSVTTIGDWAFSECSALTLVSMPEVTTIGGGAFDGCSALTLVSMPEVTTIGDWAFSECSALTSVSMPEVTTIGEYAFDGCSALTSAEMPAVTTIGGGAFNLCSALTLVSMPEVTTIGDWAFSDCSALTLVSMPEVLTIGGGAFDCCSALTLVSMPEVTTIGDWAFSECSALTSVSMPEVLTIGGGAFSYCYALTSAEMPAVTTIGEYAFDGCSALTSVDIPASVTMIGEGAFIDCDALTAVYCHWEEPLECEPFFTDEVIANATLYVPTGTVDAYRSVSPWDKFINIEEGGYSCIADTPQSEVTVKVIDGVITVEGTDGTASAPVVEVYSAGGQCVWRGTDSSIGGLPRGVYVVKVDGTVQKVAL